MDQKIKHLIHQFQNHFCLKDWWLNDENLKEYMTPPEAVVDRAEFYTEKYGRHILYHCPRFEWVMITWLPNQSTIIHNHPASQCAYFVLSGTLTEHRYLNGSQETIVLTPSDDVQYIDDSIACHSVGNVSTEKAISIHLYSPPFQLK